MCIRDRVSDIFAVEKLVDPPERDTESEHLCHNERQEIHRKSEHVEEGEADEGLFRCQDVLTVNADIGTETGQGNENWSRGKDKIDERLYERPLLHVGLFPGPDVDCPL